jgi:hypothetical protein
MTSTRVGFNKFWGVLMLCTSGLQLFTYNLTQKGMYLALAALMGVIGILYLVGACFVVDISADGSGEVQIKNPMGMTLKRHAFASVGDLSIRGNKLAITLREGGEKTVGGLLADGGDMRKLAAVLERRGAGGGGT